jgi:hypothetical protein
MTTQHTTPTRRKLPEAIKEHALEHYAHTPTSTVVSTAKRVGQPTYLIRSAIARAIMKDHPLGTSLKQKMEAYGTGGRPKSKMRDLERKQAGERKDLRIKHEKERQSLTNLIEFQAEGDAAVAESLKESAGV